MDDKQILDRAERAARSVDLPDDRYEDLLRRRDRKHRNQRIAAGVVGIAVFVASVWVVTAGGVLDRTRTPAAPGGAETGPAETGPAETGPAEPIGPVPETDFLLDLNTGEMTPLPESIAGDRPDPRDSSNEYAASPDGSRLAYTARGVNGKSQIFVANLDGAGIEQITHDLEVAAWPAWSPDGSKIAYTGHQGDDPDNIFVLDLATGTSTQLTSASLEPDPAVPDYGPWEASLPSFTPDGASIVYGAKRWETDGVGGEFEVRMVPVAGGESARLMGGQADGAQAIGNARLSPDGSVLSYSCNGYSALCVANVDGSDERVLVQSMDGVGGTSWSPEGTRIPYSTFHAQDVFIVDVATGHTTYVGEGVEPTWLDDHTLIIEMHECHNHETAARVSQGCLG